MKYLILCLMLVGCGGSPGSAPEQAQPASQMACNPIPNPSGYPDGSYTSDGCEAVVLNHTIVSTKVVCAGWCQ